MLFIAIKKKDTPICDRCGRDIGSTETFTYTASKDGFICNDCVSKDPILLNKKEQDYKRWSER